MPYIESVHPPSIKSVHPSYIKSVPPFRTYFLYSDMNYALVTYISEKLGEKRWEDLIHEELFQPLGMDSSTFASTTPDFSKVASGYRNGPGSRLVPVSHALTRYIYNTDTCIQCTL